MLESLPNEIFCIIFDYLDVGERFYSFYNIKSRFNDLLFTQYEMYRIHFRSIIKCQMDFLVEEYFPSIADRVISLRLSDDYDEGPSQTKVFFSFDLQLNNFIHLRSLSLCYIEKASIFRKIMDNCHQNPHLTYLKVIKCNSKCMVSVDFSNHIWSLPQLTHCRLDMQDDFCIPTVISLSLKYLSISCNAWWLRQTTRFVQQTPSLEHLHIPLNNLNDDPKVTSPSFLSITRLKLSNVRSSKVMENLLSAVPNLTYLKVDIFYINSDGHTWAQIIDDHLPQLKIFHLRMNVQFRGLNNKEQVDHFIDSFRSEFWLKKHQWYIHCHPQYRPDYASIFLYTLPYTFTHLNSTMLVETYRSTSDQDNYLNVASPTNHLSLIYFSNIQDVHVYLPATNYLWDISTMFYHLKPLTVSSDNENCSFDLQSLLDRSPSLYSLTIGEWPSGQIPLAQNTNASVRRLDIRANRAWDEDSYINSDICHSFIRSPLAQQCEELFINLQNRQSILDLVKNMINLRILNVQYRVLPLSSHRHFVSDSSRNEKSKDLSIKWLQDRLPQTCMISNFRVNYDSVGIHIYPKNGYTLKKLFIYCDTNYFFTGKNKSLQISKYSMDEENSK